MQLANVSTDKQGPLGQAGALHSDAKLARYWQQQVQQLLLVSNSHAQIVSWYTFPLTVPESLPLLLLLIKWLPMWHQRSVPRHDRPHHLPALVVQPLHKLVQPVLCLLLPRLLPPCFRGHVAHEQPLLGVGLKHGAAVPGV